MIAAGCPGWQMKLPSADALLYPTSMRKVLMIGAESLLPFHRGLEKDGYEVVFLTLGEAPQTEDFAPDIVVLELAEDPEVRRILEAGQTGDRPTGLAPL